MNIFHAFFDKSPRRPSRKRRRRPSRSLTTSFAALETRALLTFVGPLAVTVAANASIPALVAPMPGPNYPLMPGGTLQMNGAANPSFGSGSGRRPVDPGLGNGVPLNNATQDGDGGAGIDHVRNHVALSSMMITVNGETTPELALADAGRDQVVVRIDNQVVILGADLGVNSPQAVLLAYLDHPGPTADEPYPDLIVANSGSNNILIFRGLAGGQFSAAIGGVSGIATGVNPVGIALGDVNNDGIPDILVANQGSNSVTIIYGAGSTSSWTTNSLQTIAVGNAEQNTAPVRVMYVDANHDGQGDILVCNSGSDNVYVYQGQGNGAFNFDDPTVFSVGSNPAEMLLG